jgi:hypothetical protein
MMHRHSLLCCLTALSIDALLAPPARLRHRVRCRASDDEAPEVEEDWRAFRARLVAGGIPTTTDADEPAPAPAPVEERQGLDEDNVKLATSQSKRQGDMLREGTWAHEVGAPEVGGCVEINQRVRAPRHRAGVASMAWRSTRRFRTNAP